MKNWFIALGAALMAGTLFAFAPGGSTAVQAEDACGNDVVDVPDSGASFDFTEACELHDECYAQSAGQGESARRACDNAFLAAMLDSCSVHPRFSLDYFKCVTVAKVYYAGVRIGGWLFF